MKQTHCTEAREKSTVPQSGGQKDQQKEKREHTKKTGKAE